MACQRGYRHWHIQQSKACITATLSHISTIAHVMGDQKNRGVGLASRSLQIDENLRLNGRIDRGRRLISNRRLGPQESAMAIITRCA